MIRSPTRLKILVLRLSSGVSVQVKKLHHSVSPSGFSSRDLDGAVKILDEMPERTLPSWNKIINGYLANNSDEATFSALLKSCVDLHSVGKIHARIVRHGFDESPLLSNLMIDRYLRNGSVDSGRKVFVNLSSRDSVSVVAMISGLSRNGHEEEAVSLFAQIHASRTVSPTPYVFSSVLSACTKAELNRAGLQIHGLTLRLGFSSESYVCNALVTLYSRSGDLISAEKIFGAMENRDGISYNTLISGLSQHGFSRRALGLFERMRSDRLRPDCVTVASLLSACAAVGSMIGGKQLHSHAIKSGMTRDIVLEGSLLDLYVKCSDSKTAREFFLTTARENAVLWNVMLVSYGQSDDLIESVQIFKQMLMEGVIPNDFTYPIILRTCTSVGELNLGEQIHTQTIKAGFQHNVYVSSVLIDMYAKNRKLEAAIGILQRLKEEADVVAWTAMIAGLAKHDLFSEALELFREMEIRGIRADNIGFASAITACAGIKALKQGKQIHAQSYVSGNSNDLSIGNALVSLYSKSGRVSEAYTSFEKNENKDIVAWNSLISGFSQSGLYDEALRVYSDMNSIGIGIGVEANSFTFGSAISAAANSVNVKQGQRIHATALKSGHTSESEASNALITLYAKCGRIDDAKREFYGTTAEKTEVTWNAVITACSQHGYGHEATELFEEMKRLGFEPSHITFVAVLTACSHVGLIDDGLRYFESMSRDHGLNPKPEHYVCMVDMYGRAGRLGEAKRFVEKMPIKADAMIWRTMLSACTIHGDVDIGEFAAENLARLEPDDSATYVLSSNMYGLAGNWGFQDQTRKLMKESGVKKEIGRSWGRF